MKPSAILLFLVAILFCFSGCEDDGPRQEEGGSTDNPGVKPTAGNITFRLVDKDSQTIQDEALIIISEVRDDCNLLAPVREFSIYTGSFNHTIKKKSAIRVSVLSKAYNPVYQDLELEAEDREISIGMQPRSGITLLSYNVLEGFKNNTTNKNRFIEWVKRYDPDIILFQEMNSFTGESLQSFAAQYGHGHTVLLKEQGYPTAISSKKELTDIQKIQITNDDIAPQYKVHGYIHAKTYGIDLFCIHLSSQSDELKIRESKAIMEHINKLSDKSKVLVAGDFNSYCMNDGKLLGEARWDANLAEYKPSYYPPTIIYVPTNTMLEGGLIDVQTIGNTYYRASHPVKRTFMTDDYLGVRLDYVFLSEQLSRQCDYAEILQNDYTYTASDHFPYLVHLK